MGSPASTCSCSCNESASTHGVGNFDVRVQVRNKLSVGKSVLGPHGDFTEYHDVEDIAVLGREEGLVAIPSKDLSPLACAVMQDDLETVRKLVEAHADLEAADPFGRTVLANATKGSNVEMTKLLLSLRANVEVIVEGNPILHHAAETGDEIIIKSLLDARSNVMSLGENGYSALHTAAYCDHDMIVSILLNALAYIEARDARLRSTPLMVAAKADAVLAVMALIECRASVNTTDCLGRNCLAAAVHANAIRTTRLLLGQRVHIIDQVENYLALQKAASQICARGTNVTLGRDASDDIMCEKGWKENARNEGILGLLDFFDSSRCSVGNKDLTQDFETVTRTTARCVQRTSDSYINQFV